MIATCAAREGLTSSSNTLPSMGGLPVKTNCRGSWFLLPLIVVGLSLPSSARAADPAPAPDAKELKAVLDRAYTFLKTRQKEDGSWSADSGGPGITALIAAALVRNGWSPD